jgi:hypothetical protein
MADYANAKVFPDDPPVTSATSRVVPPSALATLPAHLCSASALAPLSTFGYTTPPDPPAIGRRDAALYAKNWQGNWLAFKCAFIGNTGSDSRAIQPPPPVALMMDRMPTLIGSDSEGQATTIQGEAVRPMWGCPKYRAIYGTSGL